MCYFTKKTNRCKPPKSTIKKERESVACFMVMGLCPGLDPDFKKKGQNL
jgi:hypothetical protein